MKKNRIALAIPVIALAAGLTLAGCHSAASSGSGQVPSALASSAHALASVPGADAKQVLIRAGVPVNGSSAQQVLWAKSMAVTANRHALAVKLAIPPQNKTAFEAALLTAVKNDGYLHSHADRVEFFDVNLPAAYEAALVVTS